MKGNKCASGYMDRTMIERCHDDQNSDVSMQQDTPMIQELGDSEDDENNVDLTISPLPHPKERKKDLTCVMANLKARLHDLDWPGFEKYAKGQLDKYPENIDYKAAVLVHRPYALRVKHGTQFALKYLLNAEQTVLDAPSSDFIRIKFLTMKAFLLYFLGDRRSARNTHEQAIQESKMLEANSSSAHNLYYYSLNSLLHNCDLWNSCGTPMESTWLRAESSYLRSCDLHKRWVEDVENDVHLSEENSAFFFLITMSKYVMCLLRTCAAPEGFYRLMTSESVTYDKLRDAGKCLDDVEADCSNLSPRGWMYYCLAQCDYHIRKTQLHGDCYKNLTRAKSWAKKASVFPANYKDTKISTFTLEFPKCRIEYIQDKMANRGFGVQDNPLDSSKLGSHLVPLKTSKFMSHLDNEKVSYSHHSRDTCTLFDPDRSMCPKQVVSTDENFELHRSMRPKQLTSTDANAEPEMSMCLKQVVSTDENIELHRSMRPKQLTSTDANTEPEMSMCPKYLASTSCVCTSDQDMLQEQTAIVFHQHQMYHSESNSIVFQSDEDETLVKTLEATCMECPGYRTFDDPEYVSLPTRLRRQSEQEADTIVKGISRSSPSEIP